MQVETIFSHFIVQFKENVDECLTKMFNESSKQVLVCSPLWLQSGSFYTKKKDKIFATCRLVVFLEIVLQLLDFFIFGGVGGGGVL